MKTFIMLFLLASQAFAGPGEIFTLIGSSVLLSQENEDEAIKQAISNAERDLRKKIAETCSAHIIKPIEYSYTVKSNQWSLDLFDVRAKAKAEFVCL